MALAPYACASGAVVLPYTADHCIQYVEQSTDGVQLQFDSAYIQYI